MFVKYKVLVTIFNTEIIINVIKTPASFVEGHASGLTQKNQEYYLYIYKDFSVKVSH